MVKKMMRQLREINALGISVTDIHLRQFHGGVLVDLSRARTAPHWSFDLSGRYWSREATLEDPGSDFTRFDEMMDRYGEKYGRRIWDRFFPSQEYRKRLRRSADAGELNMKWLKLPIAYDWKAPGTDQRRVAEVECGVQGSQECKEEEDETGEDMIDLLD